MADATDLPSLSLSLSLEHLVKWKLFFNLEELQPIERDTWSVKNKKEMWEMCTVEEKARF